MQFVSVDIASVTISSGSAQSEIYVRELFYKTSKADFFALKFLVCTYNCRLAKIHYIFAKCLQNL